MTWTITWNDLAIISYYSFKICFCQIGILLIHKTNATSYIVIVSLEHDGFDMMSNHCCRVWFGSSAPLRLCGFCSYYILRWEWWYLAPKESLLLIWLWIMQGFIWCQTMWQSSAVLYMYYILYGLWWTKAVLLHIYIVAPCCWAVLKSPWTILFTTFRLAASFFDYNKVRG